jgi:hypothetical protein
MMMSLCDLLNVQGAIDGTHISIVKTFTFHKHYHKLCPCNVMMQAIVNCKNMFTYVFVGLLGCVNDARVSHTFALYRNAQYHGMF